MKSIADNLANVRQSIKNAIISAHRPENSVQLLAVSKTKPVSAVREALSCGQKAFGENYLQDALEKISALKDETDIEWHFIGPVQSNKTKQIAEHFQWVQTVDREKIARRLHEQRPEDLPPLNVCIQVNIDEEETKSGILPRELDALAVTIEHFDNLKLRGIMAIPKANQSPEQTIQSFKKMQSLYHTLQARCASVDTLSIGMSADIPLAIAAGSTMVRVGTAIFGER